MVLTREQYDLYLRTVESLALAVDAKDQTTHGHIRRVRAYSVGLARLCGIIDKNELLTIDTGALLHDIGKLAVDDFILNKPGKLTTHEFDRMKLHATVGEEILNQIRFPFPVAKLVRSHHESWDGTGYPDGLKGESIPLGARILAIADAYDAIRSWRPYKPACGPADARQRLREASGTKFDPALVELSVRHIDTMAEEAAEGIKETPEAQFRRIFRSLFFLDSRFLHWRIRIIRHFRRPKAKVLGNHDSEIQPRIEAPGPNGRSANQHRTAHPSTIGMPLLNLVVD